MLSSHKTHSSGFTRVDSADTGPASHAKARPDFSLVFSIDANRVVRCCGSLIASLGARLVSTHAGVIHHALAVQRRFVTEAIGMPVAGLVVRPQRSAIENQTSTRARGANHSV